MKAQTTGGIAVRPVPTFGLIELAILASFVGFSILHYLFGYYFWGLDSFSVGNDDAFISYRYATNIVEHGIPSFNPDDIPPVEGFSNPLYVLLSAVAYALFGISGTYPAMSVAGVIATGAAFVMIHRHCALRYDAGIARAVLLCLCLFPSYWINATSGLESPLVFLLQTVVWIFTVRIVLDGKSGNVLPVILCSVLLVLTRTDGFTFPVFAAIILALKGHFRISMAIVASCLLTFLAIMALRYQYYGLAMPLPYYVKVSGGLVAHAVGAARDLAGMSLKSGLLVPMLGVAAALWIGLFGRRHAGRGWLRDQFDRLRDLPFEVSAAAMVVAYYFMIGGDIYRERFLLIVIAMGIVCFWIVIGRHARRVLPIALVASVAYLLSSFALDPRLAYVVESPKYDRAVNLGKFLGRAHPGALLATATAGKPPYFSQLKTIDMLGLNDRHIAMTEAKGYIAGHSKWDVGYIFDRAPDLICDHVYGEGDISYGLDRAAYEPRGYRMIYLLRNRATAGDDIIRADLLSREELAAAIARGYTFGCLAAAEVQPAQDLTLRLGD